MKRCLNAVVAALVLCAGTSAWANKAPPPPPPTQPSTLPTKGEAPAKTLSFVISGVVVSGALLCGGLLLARRGCRS